MHARITKKTTLLALLGASSGLLLVSAAPLLSGAGGVDGGHHHYYRVAEAAEAAATALARRQILPTTTRAIPGMMTIPASPTSTAPEVVVVEPSARPPAPASPAPLPVPVPVPAPPPMAGVNEGGGIAGSNPAMTGLPVLGGGGADAGADTGAGGELITATGPVEATPAAPTTTPTPAATTASKTKDDAAQVSAAPAGVAVTDETTCTEANLLRCTINEWRDAEVCFVELCL
ncbi:hypothetical protein MN608_05429 [Microdochium nivale]|nr:hypothetical protein MN608_05429 [Microdochium nivale]